MVFSMGIKASSSSITGFHIETPTSIGIERYFKAKEDKQPESLTLPDQALDTQPIVPVFPEIISYPAWPVHWLSLEVAA